MAQLGASLARLAFWVGLLAANTGCVGLYVGVAATGGVMALQERGLDGAGEDVAIRAQINQLWFERDHEMHLRLTLQVWDRRVLIAGVVTESTQREAAVALARSAGGVREVIDEIETGIVRDVGRYAADKQIEKDIELRLFFTREVDSINYSVQVVNGGVYLLGTAQDAAELSRVLAVIREVAGVRRIGNHVLLREDARRLRSAAASP